MTDVRVIAELAKRGIELYLADLDAAEPPSDVSLFGSGGCSVILIGLASAAMKYLLSPAETSPNVAYAYES